MMDREAALEFSESNSQIGQGWWRQIAWAQNQGVPEALGLTTREWADRFHPYLKMHITERREAVAELTDSGLSNRAIADVLGVDEITIRRDRRIATNVAVDGGDPEKDEAEAATFVAVALAKSCAAQPGFPDALKHVAELLESLTIFVRPYRYGGRPMSKYAAEEFSQRLGRIFVLMRQEIACVVNTRRNMLSGSPGILAKKWRER